MSNYDLHSSPEFQAYAGQLVKQMREPDSAVVMDEDTEPDAPSLPGVYFIAVEPGNRYGAFLQGIDTWFGEQRAFYVGEALDLAHRLKDHHTAVKALVRAAERDAGASAADITWDSFSFSLVTLDDPPQATRVGGPERNADDASLPERLAMESALVVAMRPAANGLGFGTKGHDADKIWELLQPDPVDGYVRPLARLRSGHAPFIDWPIGQSLGAHDPRADPATSGHARYATDADLEEALDVAHEPLPAPAAAAQHDLSVGGKRLTGGKRPPAPSAE